MRKISLIIPEKAYQEHYVSFFSLNVDPLREALHGEIRFQDLVDKMNLTTLPITEDTI